MSKCESCMEFGDDFGDNSTTFLCELKKGHLGKHRETGQHPDRKYLVEWEEVEK